MTGALKFWDGTAWNLVGAGTPGPAGPTGPQGPQGPQGPPGSPTLKLVSTAADYQANSFEFVSVTGYQTVTLPQNPAINDYVVVAVTYQYGAFVAVTGAQLIMGTVYRGTAGPLKLAGWTSAGFRFDGTNWVITEKTYGVVPPGGTYTNAIGQVLAKNSSTDWDLTWQTPYGYSSVSKSPGAPSTLAANQTLIKYGTATGSTVLPTTGVTNGTVVKIANLGSGAVTVTPGAGQTMVDKTGATVASVVVAAATFIEWTIQGTVWNPTAWGS